MSAIGGRLLVVVRRPRRLGRDADAQSIEDAFRGAASAMGTVALQGPHARVVVVSRLGHGDENQAAWAVDVPPPGSVEGFARELLRRLHASSWEALGGRWEDAEVYRYDPARMGPWEAWGAGAAWPTMTRLGAPELLDRLNASEDVMRPGGSLQDAPGDAVPAFVARQTGWLVPLVAIALGGYLLVHASSRARRARRARG